MELNELKSKYGLEFVTLLRKSTHKAQRLANAKTRLTFLCKCKSFDMIPVCCSFQSCFTRYKNLSSKKTLTNFITNTEFSMLNVQIKDAKQCIADLAESLETDINDIATITYDNDFDCFNHFDIHVSNCMRQVAKGHRKKFEALFEAKVINKLSIQDDWVRNLTSLVIPSPVKTILSLSPNFSHYPSISKKDTNNMIISLIKAIESSISYVDPELQPQYRNQMIYHTTAYLNRASKCTDPILKYIVSCKKQTHTFLKDNPDLIISKSDKTNLTVIMNKETFSQKSKNLLGDRTVYHPIRTNPLKTISKTVNSFCNKLEDSKYITKNQKLQILSHSFRLPQITFLPKIHKETIPLRPLVDGTGSHLHYLAKYLFKQIKYIPHPSAINNSIEFASTVNNIEIPPNHVMVSFDVVSLFTSIPVTLALDTIKSLWPSLQSHTQLTRSVLLEGLSIVLNNCYIQVNNLDDTSSIYKQKSGLAMGSPLSGVLADMVMDTIAIKLMDSPLKPFFLGRYVDDWFLILPPENIEPTLTFVNSIHNAIRFTLENENANNSLNFLDMTVIRDNTTIRTKWYQKPLSKYPRLTNFYSYTSPRMKKSIVFNTFYRAIRLSHNTFKQEAIKRAKTILLVNNYPIHMILEVLRKVEAKISSPPLAPSSPNNIKTKYVSFPYTEPATNTKIIRTVNKFCPDILVTNTSVTKNIHTTNTKTQYPTQARVDVVYEIPCEDCNSSYIGQTKQLLEDRLKQHKYSITNQKIVTGLSQHAKNLAHTFNFSEVTIKHVEPDYRKRLVAESVHILNNKKNCNLITDVGLCKSFADIIDKMK